MSRHGERLLFLVDSIEPQRAPGDVSRLLASECNKRGYKTALVSLNDGYVNCPTPGEEDGVTSLRLPKNIGLSKRSKELVAFNDRFRPTAVVFLFISYSFNRKGIVFGLERHLAKVFQNTRSSIFLAELWIGKYRESGVKERFVGYLQRQSVIRLVRVLKPTVVHTESPAHVAELARWGVNARYLPLIGTIPYGSSSADTWLFPELVRRGIAISEENRSDFWLFGFFGSIQVHDRRAPPRPKAVAFLKMLPEIAKRYEKQIVLISVGGTNGGDTEWHELINKTAPSIPFVVLGRKSAHEVSQYFNSLDFGLTTHAYEAVEKSTSVISMVEHGLPVIAVRDSPRHQVAVMPLLSEKQVVVASPKLIEQLGSLTRQPACPRLKTVVSQLLFDLGLE